MKKLLSLLFILLVIGVGIYYWNAREASAGPRVYRDNVVGFSFAYDASKLKLVDDKPQDADPNLIKTVRLSEPSSGGDEPPAAVVFQVFRNPSNLTPEAWIRQNPEISNAGLMRNGGTTITVAGRMSVSYEADGLYASRNAVFVDRDQVYFITGQFIDRNSDIYFAYDKLLQTLEIK